jgi:hypothetical protein
MSLHAESTMEAQQRLHAQRRNSTISSIVIASLVVVLVTLILGVFILPELSRDQADITVITPESKFDPDPPIESPKFVTEKPKPSSPSASRLKVLAAATISPVAVPVTDLDITVPTVEFGDNNDFGTSWGPGRDSGTGPVGIPPVYRKRCSQEDRLARLQETGGNPQCEDAVIKALDWLKATQNSDGSWTTGNRSAMTGLALLAYLGHCETPLSKDYGDSCLRAIIWLVNVGMKNDGKLTTNPAEKHWPYEHAIATYALAEATTFCRELGIEIPNLKETTQKAGQLIIDNQNRNTGGWDYAFDTTSARGGDLSITAWQLQALKACKHTGLEFTGLVKSVKKSLAYVESLHCRDGGFAYARADETPHAEGYRTMTGGGVLCLQLWAKGSAPAARKGVEYIASHTKFDYNTGFSDLYGHYYEAQVMMNRGGKAWRAYNAIFRDQLLHNQNPDGSWKAPGGGGKIRAVAPQFTTNAHYRTCLNTLMLEVYYRFLPGTGLVEDS